MLPFSNLVRYYSVCLSDPSTTWLSLSLSLSSASYSVTVYENITTGVEFIRIVASDADSGERGSIRFTLSGAAVSHTHIPTFTPSHSHTHMQSEQFAIGETSGAVRVVTALDREERESYNLTIIATDQGDPPLRYNTHSALPQLTWCGSWCEIHTLWCSAAPVSNWPLQCLM